MFHVKTPYHFKTFILGEVNFLTGHHSENLFGAPISAGNKPSPVTSCILIPPQLRNGLILLMKYTIEKITFSLRLQMDKFTVKMGLSCTNATVTPSLIVWRVWLPGHVSPIYIFQNSDNTVVGLPTNAYTCCYYSPYIPLWFIIVLLLLHLLFMSLVGFVYLLQIYKYILCRFF